ncbi:MAG: hypothetical protein M3177_06945 [Pseudomonadota bacterium]|nr:hypothetical protein [Pseudomonadota bacterium]
MTLPRRESVALMATTVLERLVNERRHEEAIDLAAVILEHNPRDAQVMVTQASCCGRLLQHEFAAKYRVPFLIPEPARSRYRFLAAMNEALFARAEALGWQPDPQWEPPQVAAHPLSLRRSASQAHSQPTTERAGWFMLIIRNEQGCPWRRQGPRVSIAICIGSRL